MQQGDMNASDGREYLSGTRPDPVAALEQQLAEYRERVWRAESRLETRVALRKELEAALGFADGETYDDAKFADAVKKVSAMEAEVAALEYASGYEADLMCIRKVLDDYDAPHDCEDGVSLAPKRIRLLAEQRETYKAEAELLEAEVARLRGRLHKIFMSLPTTEATREMCYTGENEERFVSAVADEFAVLERQIAALQADRDELELLIGAMYSATEIYPLTDEEDSRLNDVLQKLRDKAPAAEGGER